jgi:transposase-like protein
MPNFFQKISEKIRLAKNKIFAKEIKTEDKIVREVVTSKTLFKCPYCQSEDIVRRGTRQKKRERVQLYLCKSCLRTFTPFSIKGKHYSIRTIFDAISYYNLGFSLEQVSKIINERPAAEIDRSFKRQSLGPSTVATWVEQHRDLCAYARMRSFAVKEFSPYDVIETATLAHRQLYRFRYHRAKTKYILREDFKNYKFHPLREFLELVPVECPHQYFQEGLRASETPIKFNKTEMIVRAKENYATRLAQLVLQGVEDNKQRHEELQKFMLANDSVTVATEVPVYIKKEDLEHMQTQLGFTISGGELPKLITGHIDFLQIRNGMVHILDYKSNAAKEKPIEQLTLYALALSRLTGLRVFNFKCAWFDEKDYFEFYPLHVVYKGRKNKRRKNIKTIEGTYRINENENKIENLRPIKN